MTVHILLNIFLSILIGLIALGIGLLLRRVVVRRLKKTVLDNWLIQTLGVLVIFPPLILAIAPIVIVWDITIITSFWSQITAGLQGNDITISTYTGKVENVQLRATRLRLVSGQEINIPNSLVFGGIVVNNTLFAERRAAITLSMPQNEFIENETPEKILKIVQEVENVLPKPEPAIAVSNFSGTFGGTTGVSSGYTGQVITLILRFWIPSGRYATVTEVMLALHKALPNVDLVIEDSGGNV